MPSFPLLFALVLFPSVWACTYSRDCDDGNPSTPDVCIPDQHICINIGSPDDPDSQTVRRTLSEIKFAVNEFPLSVKEKKQIISSVVRVYKNVNPHIFLHANYLGVDVVAQWERLGRELDVNVTDFEFHRRMVDIFQQMNDRHSVYLPPRALRNTFAWLGFFAREIFEGKPTGSNNVALAKYIVSDIVEGILPTNTTFSLGSEIITYDDVDIHQAIKALGKSGYGSNEAAQREDGTTQLTYRDRTGVNMPLKKIARVGYRNQDGTTGTLKLPWMFEEIIDFNLLFELNRWSGISKPDTYVPQGGRRARQPSRASRVGRKNSTEISVSSNFQDVLYAETIELHSGSIGRLQLSSFSVPSYLFADFEAEVVRLLHQMPKHGVILDIRGNKGGAVPLVKVLADLFSAKKIPEQNVSVRANRLMARIFGDFDVSFERPWLRQLIITTRAALRSAVAVGEQFTGPTGALYTSIQNPKRKRVYFGPVVTVIDALTYSSGDLFAALQVDQKMSLLVGTSDVSGAGGATVVTYSQLYGVFSQSVGEPLPGDVEFTTAFMRWYRTGREAGKIVENFGVTPDIRYYPTRDDALHDDRDMIEFLRVQLSQLSSL